MNPAARRRQQSGLLWCSIPNTSFGDVPIRNMTRIYVLCCFNKTSCISETVKGTKIDERAFWVMLDFLSCKQCLASESRIFEHHDYASRSLVKLSTRVAQPLNACYIVVLHSFSGNCLMSDSLKGFAWLCLSGLYKAEILCHTVKLSQNCEQVKNRCFVLCSPDWSKTLRILFKCMPKKLPHVCLIHSMQIPWTVFLWQRKQMFPSFLDHPVYRWRPLDRVPPR